MKSTKNSQGIKTNPTLTAQELRSSTKKLSRLLRTCEAKKRQPRKKKNGVGQDIEL